jgi:hypothetical protein
MRRANRPQRNGRSARRRRGRRITCRTACACRRPHAWEGAGGQVGSRRGRGGPAERGHAPEADHRADGNGFKSAEQLEKLLCLGRVRPIQHADEGLFGLRCSRLVCHFSPRSSCAMRLGGSVVFHRCRSSWCATKEDTIHGRDSPHREGRDTSNLERRSYGSENRS